MLRRRNSSALAWLLHVRVRCSCTHTLGLIHVLAWRALARQCCSACGNPSIDASALPLPSLVRRHPPQSHSAQGTPALLRCWLCVPGRGVSSCRHRGSRSCMAAVRALTQSVARRAQPAPRALSHAHSQTKLAAATHQQHCPSRPHRQACMDGAASGGTSRAPAPAGWVHGGWWC